MTHSGLLRTVLTPMKQHPYDSEDNDSCYEGKLTEPPRKKIAYSIPKFVVIKMSLTAQVVEPTAMM